MTDSPQTILLLVIVILTSLLVILGVQLFFILRDFRKTIVKTNKILDAAENLSKPVAFISGLAAAAKTVSSVLKAVKGFDEVKEKPKIQKLKVVKENVFKKPIKRFFRGSKPL